MYKHYLKRTIDFIIALLALPVVLLFCFFVLIAIQFDDKGPLFHKARRIGKDGRIFNMYKFRSMVVNAPDLRMSDGSTYNAEDDPRVTKVGKFLRRTSIDEIPQMLNVLKGDMSLIGPRPDSAFYLEYYTDEERIILTVRPGITGWNQAVNRNSVGTKEKLQADIYYVKHLSFIFDCKVIMLTINTVLNHKDIYRA